MPAQPPKLLLPANGAVVDAREVVFEWEPQGDRAHWIQVARDASFQDVLYNGRAGREGVLTMTGLQVPESSTAFWRVRARDESGAWGPYAEAFCFEAEEREAPSASEQAAAAAPELPRGRVQEGETNPLLVAGIGGAVLAVLIVLAVVAYVNVRGPGAVGEEDEQGYAGLAAERDSLEQVQLGRISEYQRLEDGTVVVPIHAVMAEMVGADSTLGATEPVAQDSPDRRRSEATTMPVSRPTSSTARYQAGLLMSMSTKRNS